MWACQEFVNPRIQYARRGRFLLGWDGYLIAHDSGTEKIRRPCGRRHEYTARSWLVKKQLGADPDRTCTLKLMRLPCPSQDEVQDERQNGELGDEGAPHRPGGETPSSS